jgi:5'(3')-deoxyribonucleotidase
MSTPLTIALDVDDVVADTSTAWVAAVNARHGMVLSVRDWTEWGLGNIYGDEIANKLYAELGIVDFYDRVVPCTGAVEAIRELRGAGLRCIFVTREVDGPGMSGRKWSWLQNHGLAGPEHRRDYFEAIDKSVFRAELLVDDGLHNVLPFPTGGVLMTRPWNTSATDLPTKVQRASDWSGAMGLIRSRLALDMRHPAMRGRR